MTQDQPQDETTGAGATQCTGQRNDPKSDWPIEADRADWVDEAQELGLEFTE